MLINLFELLILKNTLLRFLLSKKEINKVVETNNLDMYEGNVFISF